MSDIVRRYAARLGEAVGRAVAPMTEELGRLRANVTLLLSEIVDLKATCAALGNEKAQEKELRLRAEAEVARMVDKYAEFMESGAREVARLESERMRAETACKLAEELRAEEMETARKALARAEAAERALEAAQFLKKTAYDELNGCRDVVEKTIIPALEAVRLEADNARVYLAQGTPKAVSGPLTRADSAAADALASARKLLED